MMKKFLALILALAMCLTLVACGDKDTGDKDPGNTNSNTEQKDDTVYKFTFSMQDAADSGVGKQYQRWVDKVHELSEGRIEITIFNNGTLATHAEVADVVAGGGADMGWVFTGMYPGQFPLSEVCSALVMGGFDCCEDATNILWDLIEEYPAIEEEWSEYKLFALYTNSNNMLLTKGKQVLSMDDIKGMNLRAPGGQITTALSKWGANPISMSAADIYQGLEKNNINGAIFDSTGVDTWRLDEQLDYYCEMPMIMATFACVMDIDKWNSLPADIQQIFIDAGIGRELSLDAGIDWDVRDQEAMDYIAEHGGTIYDMPEDAVAAFKAAIEGLDEEWAAARTAEGKVNGEEFLARTRELLAEYNAK